MSQANENSPIINSPIIIDSDQVSEDFNDCCGCGAPAGVRVFYLKFVLFTFIGFGIIVYGIYKLLEAVGWA